MNEPAEQSRLYALVLKDSVKLPPPFAPEIADISIRSPSNSFEDGYALRMSVSFGADEIRLETESHIITAQMSLKQARAELEFVSCSPTFSNLYSQKLEAEQSEVTQTHTARVVERNDTSGKIAGNVKANPQAIVAVGLGASAEISGEQSIEVSREHSISIKHNNFRHTSIDNVVIGDHQGRETLKGTIVGDYEGWKVIPKSGARSGVLATLKVKQNWINLSHISTQKKNSAQTRSSKLEEWFSAIKLGTAEKQELFEVLIKNLIYYKLQKPAERNYATLGCAVLVVEPETGNILSKVGDTEVVEFSVRDQLFESFISAENDEEARQIAEKPYSYMLPKPIYEFPQCGPVEMLQRLGVRLPRGRLEPKRSWEQDTTRIATDHAIDEDISFLKIPSNWSPYGGRNMESTVGDPVKAIALRAERIPVLSAAIQEMSLYNFGTTTEEGETGRRSFSLRRIVSRDREKHDTKREFIRRHLDQYFLKVYKNRMSENKVNHKVTLASLWVEFIIDVRRNKY